MIHLSKTTVSKHITSEILLCGHCKKTCEQLLYVFDSVEKLNFIFWWKSSSFMIICAACKCETPVSKHIIKISGANIGAAVKFIEALIYPLWLKLIFLLWTITFWIPILGMIMAVMTFKNKFYFGDASWFLWRLLFAFSVTLNCGYLYIIYVKYFQII